MKRQRIQGPDFSKVERRIRRMLNYKWKYYLFFTCFGIVERVKAENSTSFNVEKYDEFKAMLLTLQLELDVRIFSLCESIINIVLNFFDPLGRFNIRRIWMKSLVNSLTYIYAEQLAALDSFFGFQFDVELGNSFFPNMQPIKDRFEEFVDNYDRTLALPFVLEDEIKLIHELLDIARETYIVTVFQC